MFLEDSFPSNPKDTNAAKKKDDDATDGGKQSLSIVNTIAKFLLDQTVGAVMNTLFFIVGISLLRGAGWSTVVTAVQRVGLCASGSDMSLQADCSGFLADVARWVQVLAFGVVGEPRACAG